jgi:hypothetical protein
MSRYIQLIGIPHASGEPVVIAGPSYDIEALKSRYKSEFAAERVHPKFQRVEFIDSVVGVRKHKNFITPAESKRREKELKRQNADAPEPEAPEPPVDDTPPEE